MKEMFRAVNFRAESLKRIDQCNSIIEEYQDQGLRLTLRQLYYQLVSRDIIVNTEKSYKALGGLVSDARLSGLMDWDAIEDRARQPHVPLEFRDLKHRVESAVANYRLNRWAGQDYYVELWVEKDALAGVLQPLASEFHVTLMVNRGYSSSSAMYESSKRFLEAYGDGEKKLVLFYLGDHDPSGEDMVRDVRDRLAMFGAELEVQKLALTMTQVRKFSPPPNPAKLSDSRAKAYVEKFGRSSWEVDALPPNELARIIRRAFSSVVNMDLMNAVKSQEARDRDRLLEAAEQIMGGET
jgi:hypothetical protein